MSPWQCKIKQAALSFHGSNVSFPTIFRVEAGAVSLQNASEAFSRSMYFFRGRQQQRRVVGQHQHYSAIDDARHVANDAPLVLALLFCTTRQDTSREIVNISFRSGRGTCMLGSARQKLRNTSVHYMSCGHRRAKARTNTEAGMGTHLKPVAASSLVIVS